MQTSGQSRATSSRAHTVLAAAIALAVPAIASAQVDQFQFFFDGPTANGGTNQLGGFAYQSPTNTFYTAGFGGATQALRQVTFNGTNWVGQVNVGQTDWVNKFLASSSVTDNGGNGTVLPANYSSASVIGDLQLNTSTLTIAGVTYAPGTVGIAVDQATVRDTSAGNAVQPQFSKVVYAYDLRQVGATNTGRDRNSNGIVDWNDAFDPIITLADMQIVQNGATSTQTPNIARRFAFSSNGQSIYYNDAATNFGGIWKVNLTQTGTAAVTKLVESRTAGTFINTEPAVIATSVRDFASGTAGSGDQVVFRGSTSTGNIGGVNYVVDTGAASPPVRTLLSAKQMNNFFEVAGASFDLAGATSDAAGNLYLMNGNSPLGITVFDSQNRLAKIASNAEMRVFVNSILGTGSFNTNILDAKTRTITHAGENLTQILYTESTMRTPVGVTAYKVGDFDRDNDVDTDDANLFKAQLGLRGAIAATLTSTSAGITISDTDKNKLKFDLNGTPHTTAAGTTTVTAIIDWKDVKIFQQFAGLSDGDVDMDFDVDATDLTTLANNYNADGKLFTQGNLTSVRITNADKDAVNYADLVTLAANWTAANPDLSGFSAQVQADGDRAFGITAGSTRTQYKGYGGGAWSNAANWTNGVPNSAGAIASLLTKPQDDVALNVDGSYALHQLNFDNAFTYTLNGSGTLTLNASNGRAAEINTFAASPTISANVVINGDTTVAVTYATDTLTLSNMQPGTGGLTKAGPGTLAVNNIRGGALAVSGGTLSVLTNGTSAGASRVTTLAITAARMDLNDNDLIVTNGSYGGVSSLIASARASGAWTGDGLTSSAAAAAAPKNKTLGTVTGAEYLTTGQTTFDGFSVNAGDVLVKFTYYGDADLNGIVNFDDYSRTDNGFNSGGSTWFAGDYDYNGLVNFDDYSLIDLGFNTQSGTLIRAMSYLDGSDRSDRGMGAPSLQYVVDHFAQFGDVYATSFLNAVPEPGSALMIAGLAVLALTRRRLRHRR